MNAKHLKKLIILNLPYIIIGLLATNLGEAWRTAHGLNLVEKVQSLVTGGVLAAAFSDPLPSLHPADLFVGALCGLILRLAVYLRSKNAKKFRHNEEYGSARWGRDYLQVGNAMEIFRRNNVRFIAINNGIDSQDQNTFEFAPFINIMSEWYAKDISKKVTTGIKTKGASGKPVATEAPYGYIKDPDNKDFWIVDKEAAEVVKLIFTLFMEGKNRNQITVYLKDKEILTPTFYMKQQDRGTAKSRKLNEENRYNWNKATLTRILKRQEYCGDVVNFKTEKHYRDKRNHYVDKSKWQIIDNVHEPIINRNTYENVQRILKNAPVKRQNRDGEIHALSGLMYCKDCGTKMHIRTIHKNGKVQHVTYCSEYAKGKAKHPKCHSPHRIDVDDVMENITEVL